MSEEKVQGKTCVTPEFRANFPNLFTPKLNPFKNVNEYSCVALFPKGADLSQLNDIVVNACREKWGPDFLKKSESWSKPLQLPFRKHKDKMKNGILPDGYEDGGIFVNLTNRNHQPQVVDCKKKPIEDPMQIYSGVWLRALISAWAYDHKTGTRGVSLNLLAVQKIRDDVPLVGRINAEDAFQVIETDAAETKNGAVQDIQMIDFLS